MIIINFFNEEFKKAYFTIKKNKNSNYKEDVFDLTDCILKDIDNKELEINYYNNELFRLETYL